MPDTLSATPQLSAVSDCSNRRKNNEWRDKGGCGQSLRIIAANSSAVSICFRGFSGTIVSPLVSRFQFISAPPRARLRAAVT
jgi:hypothetical protein